MTFPRLDCALPKHLPAPPTNPKDIPSDDRRQLCTEISFVKGFRARTASNARLTQDLAEGHSEAILE